MARQRSEFVSGAGTAFELVKAVVNEVLDLGGSDEDVRRVLSDEKLRREIARLIIARNRLPEFWKTIKLGMSGLKTGEDFRRALKEGRYQIGEWANDMLSRLEFTASVAAEETEVDLYLATTAQLVGKGEKEGGTTKEVFAGIRCFGSELCPAEVGPQLRLQYKDQPDGERLRIAMEPIIGSDGCRKVFHVGRDSFLWLHGDYGHLNCFWPADSLWVFCCPRPGTRA